MVSLNVAKPDVTLRLDLEGIIREVSLATALEEEDAEAWLGRRWTDTVADVGGDKVRRMVEDALNTGISAFRQVNQRFPSGRELPIEYTTVRLGGRSGLLAIGKNLQAVAELQSRLIAAQQTMEQDYWKMRDVETRYRLLFQTSTEAVLLLRAANLQLVEANPAAIAALGLRSAGSNGSAECDFIARAPAAERERLRTMLQRVREFGKAPGVIVHFGDDEKGWLVRASLMTSEAGQMFLVQLAPAGAPPPAMANIESFSTDDLIENLPDGFVVINRDGVIRRANQAFLDMVEIGAKSLVVGERLSRWLGRPGADLAVLLSTLQRQNVVRLFSSTVHGQFGSNAEVELSAASSGGPDRHIAVVLRDVARRLPATAPANPLIAALGPLAEQVGKSSLRGLVGETVAVVERHYVRAALEMAGGNRTAAASLLGLSRQSLYAKLNRYELGDPPEANPADQTQR